MTKKVLLTGGSGFIGTHIANELIRQRVTPVILDVKAPRDPRGKEFIQGSVLDPKAVEDAMRTVDGVVHLASLLSVETTEKRPRETLDVALLGTRNVCNAARPGQRVVLASTSEVYGDAPAIPTPEATWPSPKSVYGVAKLACEAYVRTLVTPTGPDFTIVRYFSVYGAGQSLSFVVPKFVDLALKGEPLTLYGDGSQVRAFAHVKDVARGTVAALISPAAAGRTYNLGNGDEPVTMRELAARIIRLTESSSPLKIVPFVDSDRSAQREIYRRVPDISAAARDLLYRPTISLDEGILDVAASYRQVIA